MVSLVDGLEAAGVSELSLYRSARVPRAEPRSEHSGLDLRRPTRRPRPDENDEGEESKGRRSRAKHERRSRGHLRPEHARDHTRDEQRPAARGGEQAIGGADRTFRRVVGHPGTGDTFSRRDVDPVHDEERPDRPRAGRKGKSEIDEHLR